jgi:hypothetical protein
MYLPLIWLGISASLNQGVISFSLPARAVKMLFELNSTLNCKSYNWMDHHSDLRKIIFGIRGHGGYRLIHNADLSISNRLGQIKKSDLLGTLFATSLPH